MSYFVYCLESGDKKATYIGATINLDHRLRQHNGELKGGAKATSMKLQTNNNDSLWSRICYVKNFPDWKAALQFEWSWKNLCRRSDYLKIRPSIKRRLLALKELLEKERPTSKAIAFSEWKEAPTVIIEPKYYEEPSAELFLAVSMDVPMDTLYIS